MQTPSVGRIVHYTLSHGDADLIAARDLVGNAHSAGDVLPAIIVRAWPGVHDMVNLQVFLDGHGTHWATSRRHSEGGTPGAWHWPART